MLVQWQKDFEVGHAATDSENREIVDLLNELYLSLDGDADGDAIDRALEHLTRLLVSHLNTHPEDAPVLDRVRGLHRDWRAANRVPDHNDLRLLARWWLEHMCRNARPH